MVDYVRELIFSIILVSQAQAYIKGDVIFYYRKTFDLLLHRYFSHLL